MKMTQIKVRNMQSRNGNRVANQFTIKILKADGFVSKEYFQSYDSVIAVIDWASDITTTTLDKNFWEYSATTGKYRNIFLGENITETRKKIASGEYRLANLN